jgi:hypothetical protein
MHIGELPQSARLPECGTATPQIGNFIANGLAALPERRY